MDQFAQLPPSVASIISYQADLDDCLIFGGHASLWDSLTDAYKDAPEEGGIYALGMMLGVKYDHADSRIVYFGSTVSLRKRLQTHRGPATHSYYLDELKRRYPEAISVAFIALPNLAEEWLRAIEGSALSAMQDRFGRMPICNMTMIESPFLEKCQGIVRILPCEDVPFAVSLDRLGKQLASKQLGIPQSPWRSEEGKQEPTESVTPEPEELDESGVQRAMEQDQANLGWFSEEAVATWTSKKMSDLVQLCEQLTVPMKKTYSKVLRFESPFRKVPRPHTWGEVALIQGRIVSGTWLPEVRTWIKVVFGKELLGQSFLDSDSFRGEDISDLPQVKRRRSIRDQKAWQKEFETIEGELPESYQPLNHAPIEVADVDIQSPQMAEQLRLLKVARQTDTKLAKQLEEFARRSAIREDKYDKSRRILYQRIENRFQGVLADGLND